MGRWRCELRIALGTAAGRASGSRRWRISRSASSRWACWHWCSPARPGSRCCWSFRSSCRRSIIRCRTVADRDTVTARTLLGSETVAWDDIEGLRFGKGSWARAQLQGRRRAAASRGDVRDAATADRGQRRPSTQPVRLSLRQASGLAPLRNTHTAMPPPIPISSATNEPTNGRRAQPRPASSPYRPGPIEDDRGDHARPE